MDQVLNMKEGEMKQEMQTQQEPGKKQVLAWSLSSESTNWTLSKHFSRGGSVTGIDVRQPRDRIHFGQIIIFDGPEVAAQIVREHSEFNRLVQALKFQRDALHDLCGDSESMLSLPPSIHAKLANMRDDVDAALSAAQEQS